MKTIPKRKNLESAIHKKKKINLHMTLTKQILEF